MKEADDILFDREMRKIRLAGKVSGKNKLPLKPVAESLTKGRRLPRSVRVRLAIRDGGVLKMRVTIRYKKTTTNEIKEYEIEPYSYRYLRLNVGIRKMLFGWDVKEKRTKSFALRNIEEAVVTKRRFAPRYPVEIGTSKVVQSLMRR